MNCFFFRSHLGCTQFPVQTLCLKFIRFVYSYGTLHHCYRRKIPNRGSQTPDPSVVQRAVIAVWLPSSAWSVHFQLQVDTKFLHARAVKEYRPQLCKCFLRSTILYVSACIYTCYACTCICICSFLFTNCIYRVRIYN